MNRTTFCGADVAGWSQPHSATPNASANAAAAVHGSQECRQRAGWATAVSSSSSQASPMSRRRFLGSFSRHFRSSRRTTSGASSSRGSDFTTDASVSVRSSPSNSLLPVSISDQHDAERPDIRALVDYFAPRLLGTHVGRRSQNHACLRGRHADGGGILGARGGRRGVDRLRQSEIEDFDSAIRRDLDVGGLQIAVDDPFFVRGFQRVGNLARNSKELSASSGSGPLGDWPSTNSMTR